MALTTVAGSLQAPSDVVPRGGPTVQVLVLGDTSDEVLLVTKGLCARGISAMSAMLGDVAQAELLANLMVADLIILVVSRWSSDAQHVCEVARSIERPVMVAPERPMDHGFLLTDVGVADVAGPASDRMASLSARVVRIRALWRERGLTTIMIVDYRYERALRRLVNTQGFGEISLSPQQCELLQDLLLHTLSWNDSGGPGSIPPPLTLAQLRLSLVRRGFTTLDADRTRHLFHELSKKLNASLSRHVFVGGLRHGVYLDPSAVTEVASRTRWQ